MAVPRNMMLCIGNSVFSLPLLAAATTTNSFASLRLSTLALALLIIIKFF